MNFNDSETSYRSEAEDLMDGCKQMNYFLVSYYSLIFWLAASVYENVFVQKQSKINTQGCIELRRSQRLSQKNIFNGICTSCSNYNVYPKKIITTPPAIFSPTDLREDQEPYVLDVMAQNQEPPEFVPTLFPIETTTNQLGSLCCETLQTCEPISDLNIEQKYGFKNNSIDTKAKSIKARTNRARKPNRKTRPKPYKLSIQENATPTKLLSPTTLENSQGSCNSILLNKDFKNNGILLLQTSSTLTQKVKSPAGVAASSSTSTNVQKHCESSTKTSNVPCDTALNISNNEKLKEIPLNQLKPSLRKRSLRSIAMPDINSEQNKKTKTNSSTALTKTKRARKLNNTAQINNTIISGGINETIQEEESISAAPPFIFDLKQGFSFPLKSDSICDSSVHENLNQMAEQNKYKNKNLSKSVKSSTKRSKLNCKIKSKQYKKPLRKIKFLSKIADMNSNIMDVLNAETTTKENSHEDYVPLDLSRSKSAESLIKTCIKKSSGRSISDKLPLIGMTSITCAKPIVSYLGDIDMTGAKSEIQGKVITNCFLWITILLILV